jgi:hypothetical protein
VVTRARQRRSAVVAGALTALSMSACNALLGIHSHEGDGGAAAGGGAGDIAGTGVAGAAGGGVGAGGGDAAPFVLDDFEDLNALPADPRFSVWQFYAYNPPTAPVSSTPFSPGYNSNGAINLVWAVYDKPDGMNNSAGAGLRTLVSNSVVFVDLSKLSRMVFAHRYFNNGTCESITQFTVNIGCGELASAFNHTVAVSEAWQTVTIDLSSLIVDAYPVPNGTTLADCLAVADSIYFDVQTPLADGHCASGELDLDNISFR